MLNKLKSTVSGVLPVGNPVLREYDLGCQVASAGPGLLWKVYDASNRSTKQEASVFIFEKKSLIDQCSKRDKELILETLKRGAAQLTKLRHPNILSVLHALEDSRESLMFATEPVFASLANALGTHENLSTCLPPDLDGFKLYDVEIKYGLFQLCEGLGFLHNSCKLVHGNICPNSIVINKAGSWKIAGFDFCIVNANQCDQSPYFPHREWQSSVTPIAQPQLNYLAPEYALTMSCDTSSDMYSVGVLFYALFNYGKPVFDARDEWATYKGNIESLRRLKLSVLGSVPEDIREYIGLLLNTEPSVRPDADQLNKIPFFKDVGSLALQYLDSLFQRDNLQKSQFFKGLPKVLEKLPKRVCLKRILPPLYRECVNKDMVPFVLPCVLQVAERSSETEYVKYVWPGLVPLFKLKEPVQILLIFMQNMRLLLQKTPQNDIKIHVLPMVYGSLESPSPQIQELCLNIIPTFASLIDFTSMKNSLIPRIRKLCLSTGLLNVRVKCLICIGKLMEYMDKWCVLDDILPILPEIPSREPAVLMSMLGIYKVAMTHKRLGITKDVLANRILPFLFPIALENCLNLQQFSAFMALIKDMIEKVETEHRAKLEQLNSMQTEQRTIQIGSAENAPCNDVQAKSSQDDSLMDKLMTGFGLGSYFSSAPKMVSRPAGGGNDLGRGMVPDMNCIPEPKASDTTLPNQPTKVTLTMEEKTRLARQQEQQQRLKSQQPLTNASISPKPCGSSTDNLADFTSAAFMKDFLGGGGGGAGSASSSGSSLGSKASTIKCNNGQVMSTTGVAKGYQPPAGVKTAPGSQASFDTMLPGLPLSPFSSGICSNASDVGGAKSSSGSSLSSTTYKMYDVNSSELVNNLMASQTPNDGGTNARKSSGQMKKTPNASTYIKSEPDANDIDNLLCSSKSDSKPSLNQLVAAKKSSSSGGYPSNQQVGSVGYPSNQQVGSVQSHHDAMGGSNGSMTGRRIGGMGSQGAVMSNTNQNAFLASGPIHPMDMNAFDPLSGGSSNRSQAVKASVTKPLSSHDINDLLS